MLTPLSEFSQVVANISIADDTPVVIPFATPLRVGDTLDALVFSVYSDASITLANGCLVSLELYACNRRPVTVSEARNGQVVVPAASIAAEPYLTDSAAGEGQFIWKESFPLDFLPDQHQRFLALVLTSLSNISIQGVCFGKVFRARQRK